jgi:hypothetical protein
VGDKPIMNRKPSAENFIVGRLMGVFASLFFSVPTAFLIWLQANQVAALHFSYFFSSNYLVGMIVAFSLFALIFPTVFPSVLGFIWHGLIKLLY